MCGGDGQKHPPPLPGGGGGCLFSDHPYILLANFRAIWRKLGFHFLPRLALTSSLSETLIGEMNSKHGGFSGSEL